MDVKRKTVLIGWEAGGGLGHVMRASALAREFSLHGWRAVVCLRELAGAVLVEWPADASLLQAPLAHRLGPIANPASYGEILYGSGYHDGNQLSALVTSWSHLIELAEVDLVVADHAPTLQLAARINDVPHARIGTGFFAPPLVAYTPRFRSWEMVDAPRMAYAESQVLAAINGILEACGMERSDSLAAALVPDLDLIASWPELDCYAAQRPAGSVRYIGNEAVSGKGEVPAWPASGRKRVVAYLKAGYAAVDAVLDALGEYEAIAYVADAQRGLLESRSSRSTVLATHPLDLEALASDCDAFVCHAGAGAAPWFLAAGKPVLLLPYQAEQRVNADAIAATGAGLRLDPDVAAAQCAGALGQLLEEGRFTLAAQDLAANWVERKGGGSALALAVTEMLALVECAAQ